MTLLALEGFDHHGITDNDMDDYLSRKHASRFGSWTTETGRFGGVAAGSNSTIDAIRFQLPDVTNTEIIVGFAIKFNEIVSNSTANIMAVYARDNFIIGGVRRAGGGGPMVFGQSGSFVASTKWNIFNWNYFEFRILSATSNTGELELYMNGEQIINETGADTVATIVGIQNVDFIGNQNYDYFLDDIYILDTTGTSNNTFLGDVKVEALFPSATGFNADWAVTGAATNREAVDDNPPDDDTSYVSTSTVTDKDTHEYDDLSIITTGVKGVAIHTLAKKEGPGNRTVAPVVRSASVDYDQTNWYVPMGDTDEYGFDTEVIEEDPDTSSAWSVSGVNAAEFGYKLTS